MQRIAEYRGNLLNHVEALYRPGDRELVVALAEVLGCGIADTGIDSRSSGTYLAIHPALDDQDPSNNAIYVSQVTDEQYALEEALTELGKGDTELAGHLARYHSKAQHWPFGIPHFGLRYGSERQIEDVATRLQNAAPALQERVKICMFRPGPDSASEFIQGFIHQDIVVAGSFFLGQLIELQYQPEPEQ
ncbi:MAG TPA: hypothetical protein VHZ99_03380 [Steroidobacteraceae bacterium]|jgi:hypothetical protein|nr:hypothetical protein [Steroidobacteraceae bacterium]